MPEVTQLLSAGAGPGIQAGPTARQTHTGHPVPWRGLCSTQRCPPKAELGAKSTRVPLAKARPPGHGLWLPGGRGLFVNVTA